MRIEDLVNHDLDFVIDWLIENKKDYAIVPRVPTESMRDAFYKAKDECGYIMGLEESNHQFDSMIDAYESECGDI